MAAQDEDIAQYQARYEECRRKAIKAGVLKPRGFKEGMIANSMSYEGESFANSALAQARLAAWIEECMNGSR